MLAPAFFGRFDFPGMKVPQNRRIEAAITVPNAIRHLMNRRMIENEDCNYGRKSALAPTFNAANYVACTVGQFIVQKAGEHPGFSSASKTTETASLK